MIEAANIKHKNLQLIVVVPQTKIIENKVKRHRVEILCIKSQGSSSRLKGHASAKLRYVRALG